MSKLKHLLTQTKLPYLLAFVIIIIVQLIIGGNMVNTNHVVNKELVHDHAYIERSIRTNQHKIFKYRAQLSALSDQHDSYLLRAMMTQVLNAEMSNRNHAKVKLTNLRKNPQYMTMTQADMRIDDRDNMSIEHLQHKNSNLENILPDKHPHYLSNNITEPQLRNNPNAAERSNFTKLMSYGASIGILLVINCLILIYKLYRKQNK